MKRIRVMVTLDKDGVSPDAIKATNEYLTCLLEKRAEDQQLAVNWNSWKTSAHKQRNGDLTILQLARVI